MRSKYTQREWELMDYGVYVSLLVLTRVAKSTGRGWTQLTDGRPVVLAEVVT